jgi:hypothetical protein
MPRDQYGDSERNECDQQDDAARARRSVAGLGNSPSGEFEVSIADAGGQRYSPAQDRICLPVVRDQRVSFGSDGHDSVRRPAIGAQFLTERSRKLTLVVGSEHVEEIGHRPIDDPALAGQDLRPSLVAGKDQQNGVVFPFKGSRKS